MTPIRGRSEAETRPTITAEALVEIGPPERRDNWDSPQTTGAKASAVLLLIIVIGSLTLLQDETIRPGNQLPSSTIALSRADTHGWELLVSQGDPRPNFPEPMVWHGDRLCVGFGRVDFDLPSPRPSLARCVEPQAFQSLDRGGILVIATVRSGNDTWQFIEFGSGLDAAEVRFVDGGTLPGERVHVGAATLAIRLPNHRQIEDLRWWTATAVYRCSPEAGAWHTASWCPPSPVDG